MAKQEKRELPKARLTRDSIGKALRLFRYVRPSDRWLFALGTLFLAGTAITAIIFPRLLGNLVDGAFVFNHSEIQRAPDANQLEQTAVFFLYLFLAQAILSFLRISLYVRVTENLTYAIRRALYKSVIRQNMEFFSRNRTGDILSRFSADIAQIQETFTTNIAMFLRQLLIIVAGAVMLFFTSQKLALMMLGTIPVVVIISLFFGRYIRKISRQVQDITADNNVIVEETLNGIVNVKAFSNEDFEMHRYSDSAESLRKQSIYRGLLRGVFSSFIIVCLFGSIVFLIFQGLNMVRTGEIPIGELFEFMLLTAFVGGSIGGIAEQFVQIQKTIGAVERVMDISEQQGEEFDSDKSNLKLTGTIEFRHVGFHYPTRPEYQVLRDIDFTLEAGKSLALVGPSGAGKSTIISLLYRFYPPTSGEILINGQGIENTGLYELRNSMALVPQEIMLFGGTIYENIQYGNPTAPEEEVIKASKLANAHDFITEFPESYETVVGDRGIRLSGGQRQRIAIARAILKNPNFLILDEATSSLDSSSERLVQDALETLMKGRTSIVIAHRLSTIRSCDRIAVIRQGSIDEYGTHEELLKAGGLYQKMAEMQLDPAVFFNEDK